MSGAASKISLIRKLISSHNDFPRPGVIFWDIFPVLKKPDAFEALKDLLITNCAKHIPEVTVICAIDSRGFLFGPMISLHFKLPFIPIRKKGKLPGEVLTHTYEMEYGTVSVFLTLTPKNELEVQKNALLPGSKVLIVDDMLATGGTLKAGCQLIKILGSEVKHCLVIMEIEELDGRKNLPCPTHSLFKL